MIFVLFCCNTFVNVTITGVLFTIAICGTTQLYLVMISYVLCT